MPLKVVFLRPVSTKALYYSTTLTAIKRSDSLSRGAFSGSDFDRTDRILTERIFRGFLLFGRRIFSRIFSPDFFSSFLWEKVPRKIFQENPRQNPPKFIQQKSPTHFCRGSGPSF